MVRLVLLLSSTVFFSSCKLQLEKNSIPEVYKLKNDLEFEFNKGILFYNEVRYSGYTLNLSNKSDTLSLHGYVDGKLQGWSFEKHLNGNIKSRRYYENGKQEGIHKGWWQNGQMKFRYSFKNDLYEGELKEWYPTGQLFRLFHYKQGQEFGNQKMWKSDGRMKANYEIKNGRRYGLVGVKNCENVWGEVDSALRSISDTSKL